MFKNYSLSAYTVPAKWTNLPKSNLERQWPLGWTCEIPKLTFLKTKLDNHSSKILQTEENEYFDCYSEVFKCYQEAKTVSLQNNILADAKKDKKTSKSSYPSSLVFKGRPTLRHHLSSLLHHLHLLYTLSSPKKLSSQISFFTKTIPSPFPLNISEATF